MKSPKDKQMKPYADDFVIIASRRSKKDKKKKASVKDRNPGMVTK